MDNGGLYLLIKPSGAKLWRFKYRYAGRELALAVGTYPATFLKEARARRDEAKKLLDQGIDPGAEKMRKAVAAMAQAHNTFAAVATELLEKAGKDGIAKVTKVRNDRCLKQLEADLGKRPISEIQAFVFWRR